MTSQRLICLLKFVKYKAGLVDCALRGWGSVIKADDISYCNFCLKNITLKNSITEKAVWSCLVFPSVIPNKIVGCS